MQGVTDNSYDSVLKTQQVGYPRSILNQWKSLPNLWLSQKCEAIAREKRCIFRTRADTLVPESFFPAGMERSKSMDFARRCEVNMDFNQSYEDEEDVDLSTFDLYLSKDFTDFMNISLSERSDLDSTEGKDELEESMDTWTELQAGQLTHSNLTQSLASRMYSYENLDRVGKNLYKINKWFQKCNIEENNGTTTDTFKTTS